MKIKNGYILRKLGDAAVVVPVGDDVIDVRGMITLNDTAAFLWDTLQAPKTLDSLTASLMDTYDVDTARAREDIERFIALLRKHDLLEEEA